jgi:hypothetical protein
MIKKRTPLECKINQINDEFNSTWEKHILKASIISLETPLTALETFAVSHSVIEHLNKPLLMKTQ